MGVQQVTGRVVVVGVGGAPTKHTDEEGLVD